MNEEQSRTLSSASRRSSTPLAAMARELWRYKWIIPAVAVLVSGLVAFWLVRQPKVYEALATLEYDPNPTLPLGSAVDDTAASSNAFWDTQEFYATQNFILKSRALAERVAKKLQLVDDEDFWPPPSKDDTGPRRRHSVEETAERLLGSVDVSQVRDTRVVRVSVRDYVPQRAQQIANAWLEAYIEKSLEDRLGTSGRALEWLSTQMGNLKRELESSEIALYRFREQHHSLSASLDERRKVIGSQLQSYTDTMTEIHAKRVQTEARLSVVREMLGPTADLMAISVGPIGESSAVEALRTAYREATQDLQKLTLTYGENHPDVRAASARRDSLLAQLTAQIAGLVTAVEGELVQYERAEKGIREVLEQVNRQGLELSLQEIDYSRLERERASKAELFDLVMERAAQTDLTRALRVANGRVIDTAVVPMIAVSPRVRLIGTLGVLLGLVMGVLTALAISMLDNKVRGPLDVEAQGVTLLGILPAVQDVALVGGYSKGRKRRTRKIDNAQRDMLVHLEPRSTTAECCRTIRTNLTFQSADKPLRALAITSAMPRDGKSTVSISIATIIAQSGKRVLLVDTDLRKPRLHRVFGHHTANGVTTVLAGECTLDEAVLATEVPNLSLLQCGPIPPNPAELLHTRRFADLIKETRDRFDTVIFDTPPLGAVTDPAVIGTQVDGVIVVVRSGSTARGGMDAALRQLRGVGAPITGVVLNDVNLSDSSYGAYYAYYRGYYAEDGVSTPDARGGGSPRAAS